MKIPFLRRLAVVGLSLLLLAPGSFVSAAEDAAGTVTRLKGLAVAMQDALPRPLKVGDKILRGDVISTVVRVAVVRLWYVQPRLSDILDLLQK